MITFNIGDRVRVKCSEVEGAGVIADKLYSEAQSKFIFRVCFDGHEKPSNASFDADSLELIKEEPITYRHEFDYLDNVVVCRFYEVQGKVETEIMRGHGHIIHDGALGIAQASAYALKRIWLKMEGDIND